MTCLLNALLPSDSITEAALSSPDTHGGFEFGTWDFSYWPMIRLATGMTTERGDAIWNDSSPFTADECAAVVKHLEAGESTEVEGKRCIMVDGLDMEHKAAKLPLIPQWHERLLHLFKSGRVTLVHEGYLRKKEVVVLPKGAVYTCPVRGERAVDVVLSDYDENVKGPRSLDHVLIQMGAGPSYCAPRRDIELEGRMCYTWYPKLKLAPVEQVVRAIDRLAIIRADIVKQHAEELARIDQTMGHLVAYRDKAESS